MNKYLVMVIDKFRYGKKLDLKTCGLVLFFFSVMAVVGVYVYGSGRDSIIAGTVFDYLLYLYLWIFSLNSLYLSFELGVKFKEKEISE